MLSNLEATGYLIDGFPRELCQGELFKQQVSVRHCTKLHVTCGYIIISGMFCCNVIIIGIIINRNMRDLFIPSPTAGV